MDVYNTGFRHYWQQSCGGSFALSKFGWQVIKSISSTKTCVNSNDIYWMYLQNANNFYVGGFMWYSAIGPVTKITYGDIVIYK